MFINMVYFIWTQTDFIYFLEFNISCFKNGSQNDLLGLSVCFTFLNFLLRISKDCLQMSCPYTILPT